MLFQKLLRTARPVHPEPAWNGTLARIKYVARGLVRPRLTAEWLEIAASPSLAPLVSTHPYILSKLQRPYLHRRLGAAGRLAALRSHYQFVTDILDDRMREEILRPEGFVVANLPETDAGRYSLRLYYAIHFSKEGELCLGLFDESGSQPLVTLTFCVCDSAVPGEKEIFIGGLQSRRDDNMRDLVVKLTRSLHGLRPKALMVFAIQRLAQTWGILGIKAVAREEHIYRHYLKRKHLHADYDEFWKECNGAPQADGNYRLPPVPLSRDIKELPRNKRPVYRRRYEMLADVGDEIACRALGWEWNGFQTMMPEEFDGLNETLQQPDVSLMLADDFETEWSGNFEVVREPETMAHLPAAVNLVPELAVVGA